MSKQRKPKTIEVTEIIEPAVTQAIAALTDDKRVHKLAGWRGTTPVPFCGANSTFATQYWSAVNCPVCKTERQKQVIAMTQGK